MVGDVIRDPIWGAGDLSRGAGDLPAAGLGARCACHASGGMASTAGAQAGGWQIPGASTEVAGPPNGIAYHITDHPINLWPNPGALPAAQPPYSARLPIKHPCPT